MTGLLYELIYVLTVAAGAVATLDQYVGLSELNVLIVLITVLTATVFTVFKNSDWMVRLSVIGVVIAFVSALFLASRNDAIYEKLAENRNYLWLLLIGAVAFAMGELCAYIRIVRIALSTVLTGLFIYSAVTGYAVVNLTVCSGLLMILLTITQEIQRYWIKSGYTDMRAHLTYVAPFLIITVLIIYLCPSPERAYDWRLVKKIYQRAYNKIEELSVRLSIDYGYDAVDSMMTFNGRDNLPGSVDNDKYEVMVLSNIPAGVTSLKLTGKTFSDFDGKKWEDNDESSAPDTTLDTLAMLGSVRDYSDIVTDYVKRSEIGIRYTRLNTAYVFAPLKSISSGNRLSDAGLENKGGDMIWPELKSFKTEYSVPYYQMNMGNDVFKEYLRQAKVPSKDSYDIYLNMYVHGDTTGYAYEDMIRHTEHIKSTYTAMTEVSETLRTYLDSLYEGAEDDLEKMSRLETMLRTLEYTESPGEIPGRVKSPSDFLDYFLLENKRGYCSHFATAFVLLARAEGLPARYVQGYIVYTGGKPEASVYSNMSHAWPEVYFEGIGWVAYEPTPAYAVVNSYWRTEDETVRMYEEAKNSYINEEDEQAEDIPEIPEADDKNRILIPWYAIVIPIIAGILFVVLFYTVIRLIEWIRYRNMEPEKRFIKVCRQDMFILRLLGNPIHDTETLREYKNRIEEDILSENTGFLSALERHLYGRDAITYDAEKDACNTRKRLLYILKKEHPLRYIRYLSRLE